MKEKRKRKMGIQMDDLAMKVKQLEQDLLSKANLKARERNRRKRLS